MLDFLIIIVFIVIAVATSGKKDKTEEIDLDFQDLASLDDFFKSKAPGRSSNAAPPPPPRSSPPPIDRSSSFNQPEKAQKPRLSQTLATDTFHTSQKARDSFESKAPGRAEKTSLINQHFDREQAAFDSKSAADSAFAREESAAIAREEFYSFTSESKFSLKREDLVKSFILSEVMTRYNLNRIYDRIPDFKDD